MKEGVVFKIPFRYQKEVLALLKMYVTLERFGERFAPFFMMAGAPGYTRGAGNLCPRLTLAMHQALAGGDYQEGMRLMNIIRPIEDYRARDNHSYNVSFLKSAIRHLGMDFGEPRPPYRRLTEAEHDELESMIQPILRAEAELS